MELLAPRPTPSLEVQWTVPSLAPTLLPGWLWRPYQKLTLPPT